jgi:hypothetical protein
MTFTLSIRIVNDALAGVEFSDNAQPVSIGAALQALDAARAALLNVPIAQPQPAAPPAVQP